MIDVFRELDVAGNGTIQVEEFIAAMGSLGLCGPVSRTRLLSRKLLSLLDLEGKSQVTFS